ncbi:YihY/virulence factor BrkB family protein [Hamadaea tsunoensis]|uniref:YihY/virulence factor BrkB family protein n=1 Tax=Hamadaea tsunoensis TaxID=53368 RepID=UPI000420E186|nr:YihY/virulence factor BrkB family protein [Hamadaea tsunoensis]
MAEKTPKPASPWQLRGTEWRSALVRTGKEFQADKLSVWAAALTYYGMLSLFPGILVLVAVVGLLDDTAVRRTLDQLAPIIPGSVQDILNAALGNVQDNHGKTWLAVVIGLVLALWSASGYVNAFMQASNAIYDVPEGRPIWKRLPLRLGVTVVIGVLLVISLFTVVLSGGVAERLGALVGLSEQAVTVWKVLKWPLLVVLVAVMLAILYWASPNARQGGFRWISPGGLLAVVLWIAISAGFGFYAGHFGSYNRTYGALGGIIVFLVWLWLTNLAILLGAEFDAELQRQRAIRAGAPADEEPYLELRDDTKVDDGRTQDRGDLG